MIVKYSAQRLSMAARLVRFGQFVGRSCKHAVVRPELWTRPGRAQLNCLVTER